MQTVTSKDGTSIAFEQSGQGPALILVLGAFNDRTDGDALAQSLEAHFTVFNYDRRGRGDSADTLPYAIEREIEDLDALISQAGGTAFVFGYSSGAILALRAAAQGLAISMLALYEPAPTDSRLSDLIPQLSEMIAEGRRGDAVELFQTDAVGIPPEIVTQLRQAPFCPALEKMAHTLVYELTILSPLPDDLLSSIRIPALVIDGENSPAVMHDVAHSIAIALPDHRYRTLEDQTHDIVPAVVTPVLESFFLET